VVSNAEGQLEYEFDDPLHIQDPAEDNVVPVEPFLAALEKMELYLIKYKDTYF
jgi:hypothetical protein